MSGYSMSFRDSAADKVTFTVNGVKFTIGCEVPAVTSLNSFLRDHCNLKGTKFMCNEGGCGACVVSVVSKNAFTQEENRYAVNSCLVPIHGCQGWAITTIEGIGNRKIGYHKLQTRLAEFSGTQCGYCSPGMIMNMYSISEGKQITMKEVECSFGGNICRCTGYRSILDSFKSVCIDASPALKYRVQDIEDLHQIKKCKKTGKVCIGNCGHIHGDNEECLEDDFVHVNESGKEIMQYSRLSPLHLSLNCGAEWYKAVKLDDVYNILSQIGTTPYMLVAGNTAHGVYRVSSPPQVYVDIKDVPELINYSVGSTLKLGGNLSLTDTIKLFTDVSKKDKNFSYTSVLADHIKMVANVPVRNIGTLAGNLMTKHDHNEFISDIFLLFEAVGATLNIGSGGKTEVKKLPEFLDFDMQKKLIQTIKLPPIDESVTVSTYKMMQRFENAHAYVGAGFKFQLDINHNGRVLSRPTLVFSGINPDFIHAGQTEEYLYGKNLFDVKVLQTALQTLHSELNPDYIPPDASPEFRKMLACSLFYKNVLSFKPPQLQNSFVSGGQILKRPLSSGKQTFQTDENKWPLTEPLPKLEAVAQCSGEAVYVNDIPPIPCELFAAFVVTTVGKGSIENIDASEALKIPGVVKLLTVDDIPGKNSFIIPDGILFFEDEEILCGGLVKYAGQPLAILLAETHSLAVTAASKVKVTYADVSKPKLHLNDVIDSQDESRIKVLIPPDSVTPDRSKTTKVITGTFESGTQYHFSMETQHCVCIPTEDGLDVFPTTQYMAYIEMAISQALNMHQSRINVKVRRLGGGFGGKVIRNSLVSAGCAIAAHHLNRAVRFILPLETNMEAIGMRYSARVDYEVGVDDDGKIQYLNSSIYEDAGSSWNEKYASAALTGFKNCYDTSTWNVTTLGVQTDIPTTTWCRAPGTSEGTAAIEHVMEHISKTVNKDPNDIRLLNMNVEMTDIIQIMDDLKKTSEYNARKQSIDDFNKNNRWIKKGISLVPIVFEVLFFERYYAMVSIYGPDGSVAIVTGGIECGQGLNTKVAQTAASILGCSLDLISVKPSNNLDAPNNHLTGGSYTSEVCCYSVTVCCNELLKRMKPVIDANKDATWAEVVSLSVNEMINLNASHMFPYGDTKLNPYLTFGCAAIEVELDVLTGQNQILRVDILEDAGRSENPDIDIGQVEGAFIMGLGLWRQEFIFYDDNSGQNLTNRTWNYKPPVCRDIPIDFRIGLRENSSNPHGFTRAKAVGEPPLGLSCSFFLALRHAIDSVRKDAGLPDTFFELNLPATPENTFLACELDIKNFTL